MDKNIVLKAVVLLFDQRKCIDRHNPYHNEDLLSRSRLFGHQFVEFVRRNRLGIDIELFFQRGSQLIFRNTVEEIATSIVLA